MSPAAARGRLILVPSPLTQAAEERPWLCEPDRERVAALTRFYVETPKIARLWLKRLGPAAPLQSLDIRPLPAAPASGDGRIDWTDWLAPLRAGQDAGLMSDAGCPGVADPGAALVAAAHDAGIEVVPLIGPSSILLGLMASGLDGQRFAFHGYLPVDRAERAQAIAELGRRSSARRETQILIETPYRNAAMADSLIGVLPGTARLCIAVDLCGSGQWIRTRRVQAWKQDRPVLDRRLPAVFLFLG